MEKDIARPERLTATPETAVSPAPAIVENQGDLSQDLNKKTNKSIKRIGGITGLATTTLFAGTGAVRGQEASPIPSPEPTPIVSFMDVADTDNNGTLDLGEVLIGIPKYVEAVSQRAQEIAEEIKAEQDADENEDLNKSQDPSPDSFEALLESKIDKNIKFSKVKSFVNTIFQNDDYRKSLQSLHASYSLDIKANSKYILNDIDKCINGGNDKALICTGRITDFIMYARQYPINSGDETSLKLNSAFINAARLLRSATVNSGVPVKQLDRSIKSSAVYFDSPNYLENLE